MPYEKHAPFVDDVLKEDHELDRRKLAKLVKIRLTYGKSTFYDTHRHSPRYPIEVIGEALMKLVSRSAKAGEQFELSPDEFKLWKQMFPGTSKSRKKPDLNPSSFR